MGNTGAEKRRYRRIYFPGEMVVNGVIAQADTPDMEFPIKILNLSEGGLFFTIIKELGKKIHDRGSVLFKGMSGPEPYNISQETAMVIKWECGDEIMENVGYGCEFVNPPARFVDRIRDMVENFLVDDMV